jgi:hypothetical protein
MDGGNHDVFIVAFRGPQWESQGKQQMP